MMWFAVLSVSWFRRPLVGGVESRYNSQSARVQASSRHEAFILSWDRMRQACPDLPDDAVVTFWSCEPDVLPAEDTTGDGLPDSEGS